MPEQKILIVEDEDLIAQSLIMRLEKEGYEALRAENGFEGLRAAIKNKPDFLGEKPHDIKEILKNLK